MLREIIGKNKSNSATPRRTSDEREFLPAAVEIIESPASPAGRLVALTIVAAAIFAVGWACLGKVDEIATAEGHIVPQGKTKIIQPMDSGVVSAIHVADGAFVRAGDVLIELDPTQAKADHDRYMHDLRLAQLDLARLNGVWSALKNGRALQLVNPPSEASALEIEAARAAMHSQASEQAAKLADLDQQIAEKNAEIGETSSTIEKLQASLPLVQQQADLRESLMNMQFGNKLAYLQVKQQLTEQQHEIPALDHHKDEAIAERQALQRKREQTAAEYEKNVLNDLDKTQQQVSELQAALIKSEKTLSLKTLRSPINGTVQQLSVHTIGGVVTPAQALLVVVPDNAGLMVEAMVSNRDIGFVHVGQPVKIKINTFNFTRYGLVDGTVLTLSHDAVTEQAQDKNKKSDSGSEDTSSENSDHSGYVARIALSRNWIDTETGRTLLGPGMAVTAEIHTGNRLIIDYLLSPIARKIQESMHER